MNEKWKTVEFYREHINRTCHINHRVSDRTYWEAFRGDFYEHLKKIAPKYGAGIPVLKISDYMRFKTEGNRIVYENPYLERRNAFLWYVYMEAIENEGKYLNDIIDTLWAILEETNWCIPAHNHHTRNNDIIPHEGDSALELFTGMTAAYVSAGYYIFKEKLDAISGEFGNRIKKKIHREVFDNFLEKDYWWLGFGERKPNNWNPWCVCNVVKSLINLEQYGEYEYRLLARAASVIDNYYSQYPQDGGCDEGAGYWSVGCGNLLEYLQFMYLLTDGAMNEIHSDKVRRIAEFPLHCYVSSEHKLGFSDLVVKSEHDFGHLYYVGKSTKSSAVMALAKICYEKWQEHGEGFGEVPRAMQVAYDRVLYTAEAMSELPNLEAEAEFSKLHYYEGIRLFVARQKKEPSFGLFLAVKANHNRESHNHLDTGNYIVYKNEVPFIVDAGSRVYDAGSFSLEQRYKYWHTRSGYHNLPIIGGKEQVFGEGYKAENVAVHNDFIRFQLEKAYDEEFINSYVREIGLDRENSRVVLREDLDMQEIKEVTFVFMTPADVEISDKISLTYKEEKLDIVFNHEFTIHIENIDDNDKNIVTTWGNDLKRITLTTKIKQGCFEFVIQ